MIFPLGNVQILKEFLSDAEAEVRSLAQLYANVVLILFFSFEDSFVLK